MYTESQRRFERPYGGYCFLYASISLICVAILGYKLLQSECCCHFHILKKGNGTPSPINAALLLQMLTFFFLLHQTNPYGGLFSLIIQNRFLLNLSVGTPGFIYYTTNLLQSLTPFECLIIGLFFLCCKIMKGNENFFGSTSVLECPITPILPQSLFFIPLQGIPFIKKFPLLFHCK